MKKNKDKKNEYVIFDVGSKGVVLEECVQPTSDIGNTKLIIKNTNFTIVRFLVNSNQVLVNCVKDNEKYSAYFSYDFILHNCKISMQNQLKPIDTVYVTERETKVLDLRFFVYCALYFSVLLIGFLIGKVI